MLVSGDVLADRCEASVDGDIQHHTLPSGHRPGHLCRPCLHLGMLTPRLRIGRNQEVVSGTMSSQIVMLPKGVVQLFDNVIES